MAERQKKTYMRYRVDPLVPMPKTTRWRRKRLADKGKNLQKQSGTHAEMDTTEIYTEEMVKDTNDLYNNAPNVASASRSTEASTCGSGSTEVIEGSAATNTSNSNRHHSSGGDSCGNLPVESPDSESLVSRQPTRAESMEKNTTCEDKLSAETSGDFGISKVHHITESSFHTHVMVDEKRENEFPQAAHPEFDSCANESECNKERLMDYDCQPLYKGAPVTLGETMLLLLMMYLKHSLTLQCLEDILLVVNSLLIVPIVMKTNIKQFKAFFANLSSPLVYHYVCAGCSTYFGAKEDIPELCPACNSNLQTDGSTLWFVSMPIKHQLQDLLSDSEILDSISDYRHRRKVNSDAIEDLMDGNLYKDHFDSEGFFHNTPREARKSEIHLSFQINTDGVSLFHSSTFSIWPLYLMINELDPKLRRQRRYRIFAGLWFGYKKPYMKTFLRPFAEELKDLFRKGCEIKRNEHHVRVRTILLYGSFDAPARCMFMEMVQFNGAFGCPFCLTKGESVKTSERGHTHCYPVNLESASGCGPPRTHSTALTDAREADQTGTRVNGFKGTTWAMFVPGYDLVRGTAIDYMHQVLLGVTRMLAGLWFDRKHKAMSFSVSNRMSEIDARFLGTQPPNRVTRVPRKLEENWTSFKASEWRSFLLYFGVPCLWNILPEKYFNHFAQLVEAVHILLGRSILPYQIQRARELLKLFCVQIKPLYGPRYETSNMHALLHLADKVKDIGPLWACSLFYFEDLNGEIRRMFHGTQKVELQILNIVSIQHKIPLLESYIAPGSIVQGVYSRLVKGNLRYDIREQVMPGMNVVGASTVFRPLGKPRQAISCAIPMYGQLYKFKRLYNRGDIVHCAEYQNVNRRNSYSVTVSSLDGSKRHYGQVLYFVKATNLCPNPSCCNHSCACQVSKYYALLQLLEPTLEPISSSAGLQQCAKHVFPVRKSTNVICIDLERWNLEICVFVALTKDVQFLCTVPNTVEKD